MAIGTGTAIAIGAGISGAATIYGASKQAGANKDAAATQAASADKALAITKEMYDQTRTDEAPYRAIGGGALGALSHGLGIAPTSAAAPAPVSPMKSLEGAPHSSNPNNRAPIGTAMPRPADQPVPPMAERRDRGPISGAQNPVEIAAHARTQSGYVQMRSPSGQVGRIPIANVPAAEAAGGTVVR